MNILNFKSLGLYSRICTIAFIGDSITEQDNTGPEIYKTDEYNKECILKYNCCKKIFILLNFFIFSGALILSAAGDETSDSAEETASLEQTGYDVTSDEEPVDYEWIQSYSSLDPSDDLFYGKEMKHYKPTVDYVKNLKYRNEISFYIDDFDRSNPTQNSNNLPWFPHIFLPLGTIELQLGGDVGLMLPLVDFGFVYRADNLMNTRMILSAGFMFSQLGNFNYMLNIEYPAFLKEDRLRFFNTSSFYTSGPQYITSYYYYNYGNLWLNLFNKVWKKTGTEFTRRNTTGFSNITGIDFRVPFIETNVVNALEINLHYIDDEIISYVDKKGDGTLDFPPVIEHISDTGFNINFIQEYKVDLRKQTPTIPEGLYMSLFTKYHTPIQVGHKAKEFRFESRAEAKFSKKIFREYGFKMRLLAIGNYNISRDFSKAYFRGLSPQELTGFFGVIGNFELLIPLVNLKIQKAGGISLSKEGNFIVYVIPFLDAGFSIENDLIYLGEPTPRKTDEKYITKERYRDAFFFKNYYLTPALTSGVSIKAQPYFLHFVISLDIAFDVLRPVLAEQGFTLTDITIAFTFNDLF